MRALAIGCHPDDLEIACSGTLRKYVEQGADVYMCHVANGNQGRYTRPDVIITHNPQDYMQDHVETSHIATNASFCSGLAHRPRKFEPYSSFVPVFFMDTLAGVDFQPTHYVDITDQIERKLQALAMHESQIKWMLEHDGIDFVDMVRTCSRYRGYQCGVAYAEGFRPYNVYPRYSTKHLLP